jgi:hypothetical protein
MKATLKRLTPPPLWALAREGRNWLHRLPGWPAAYLHPWRRASRRRLAALKDVHRGRRAFIIGNGPSLNRTDLTRLRGEITFGMNRIYLLFPELGFHTTYFVSVNDLVIQQCAEEIRRLPMPKFLSWHARRFIQPTEDTVFLYTPLYLSPRFTRDARGMLWEGATVTTVALQLAFHMGFDEVILIGVDHNFVSKGPPHQAVTSQGDDLNHFRPDYFGRGFTWQLPDLETSEIGYRLARRAYESAGRRVLDATVGGKLTVFPKVDYESLF